MTIYLPSYGLKLKDFCKRIRANWQEYKEAHVADFDAHLDQYEAHASGF